MQVAPHEFAAHDYVGGCPVLDFVNTVTARDSQPVDWVDSYERLMAWAHGVTDFDPRILDRLRDLAAHDPAAAETALARAKVLREALFDIFSAEASGRHGPAAALAELDKAWKASVIASDLGPHGPVLDPDRAALDYPVFALTRVAVDRLVKGHGGKLKQCAGPDCAWLFFDTSKAGRRRWCDMAVCGNAAKARRHYARSRRQPA